MSTIGHRRTFIFLRFLAVLGIRSNSQLALAQPQENTPAGHDAAKIASDEVPATLGHTSNSCKRAWTLNGPIEIGNSVTPAEIISRRPGGWNDDLSIMKNFPLQEHAMINFRANAYNALNHVVVGNCHANWSCFLNNAVADANTFGSFYGWTSGRTIQLAVSIN